MDEKGAVLGPHPGIQYFTIGQRRGLGLQGNTGSPVYVVDIDPGTGRVTLGPNESLYRTDFWASKVNFLSGEPPKGPVEITAKIRYKASESAATLIVRGDWAELRFREPQRAITPGQAVVFYDGEEVLGGGTIELEAPARPTAADAETAEALSV